MEKNKTPAPRRQPHSTVTKTPEEKALAFNKFCAHLEEYHLEYGNMDIKRDYVCPDGYNLGYMVAFTRRARRLELTKILSEDEIITLSALGFVWKPGNAQQRHYSAFREFYNHMLEYKAEHGNLYVKNNYVSPDGYDLGQKVNRNRRIVAGELAHGVITHFEKKALERIGFIWDVNLATFTEFCEEYSAYIAEFGSQQLPLDYVTKSGYPLEHQANFYRRIKDKDTPALPHDYQVSLTKLGFEWHIPSNLRPNIYVLNRKTDDEEPCAEHSLKASAPKMPHQPITVLESTTHTKSGIYDQMTTTEFNEFVNELKIYKRRNKHFNVPVQYTSMNGYKLGQKVAKVFEAETNGESKFSPSQKFQLEKLGFSVDVEPLGKTVLKDTAEKVQQGDNAETRPGAITPNSHSDAKSEQITKENSIPTEIKNNQTK